MNAKTDAIVVLHRIDVSRNMARFYAMHLTPTLFGEIAVVRNWGRIGGQGRVRSDIFTSPEEARTAVERLHAQKSRRGYRRPS